MQQITEDQMLKTVLKSEEYMSTLAENMAMQRTSLECIMKFLIAERFLSTECY
jgi:hypothetical protein